MSEPAQRVLVAYYSRQRQGDSRVAARTTIRLLESLVRLAQAHARLCYRHEAILTDAIYAVILMEASSSGTGLIGGGDLSPLHSEFAPDVEAEYGAFSAAILHQLGLGSLVSAD